MIFFKLRSEPTKKKNKIKYKLVKFTLEFNKNKKKI